MRWFFVVVSFALSCFSSAIAMAQTKSASSPPPNPPAAVAPAPHTDSEEAWIMGSVARHHDQLRREVEVRPSGRKVRPSGRKLINSGAVLLVLGYMGSMVPGIVMMADGVSEGGYLFIPLVGTPICIGELMSHGGNRDSEWFPVFALIFTPMTMPAVAQLTGIILLSSGLIQRARYQKEKRVTYAFAPTVTSKNLGMSFAMTF